MPSPTNDQLSQSQLAAASFAENLARQYVVRGGDSASLLAAFAGLVFACDPKVATDALIALEGAIASRTTKNGL